MMKWVLAGVSALAVGCSVAEQAEVPPDTAAEQQLAIDNGRELNGRELNGRELNGRELNGRELNGRELNGRELNGRELNGQYFGSGASVQLVRISLDGSQLVGHTAGGQTVKGAEMAGIEITGDTASAFDMRIEAAKSSRDSRIGDVWRYQVSFKSNGSWLPLCGVDAQKNPVLAIPLAGVWNYGSGVQGGGDHLDTADMITFACDGAALAKCVDFGYAPWAKFAGRALAPFHQSCTRMVRADFCGDGRSFTKDGTVVNVYDALNIQMDTESWNFEAEWKENGASCIKKRRITGGNTVPECARNFNQSSCGNRDHFSSGTLLMSEYDQEP